MKLLRMLPWALLPIVGGLIPVVVIGGAILLRMHRAEQAQRRMDLASLGLSYHTFLSHHDRSPTNLADFRQGLTPGATQRRSLGE